MNESSAFGKQSHHQNTFEQSSIVGAVPNNIGFDSIIKESTSRNDYVRTHTINGAIKTAAMAIGAEEIDDLSKESLLKRRMNSGMTLGGRSSPLSLKEKQNPILHQEISIRQVNDRSAKDVKSQLSTRNRQSRNNDFNHSVRNYGLSTKGSQKNRHGSSYFEFTLTGAEPVAVRPCC